MINRVDTYYYLASFMSRLGANAKKTSNFRPADP